MLTQERQLFLTTMLKQEVVKLGDENLSEEEIIFALSELGTGKYKPIALDLSSLVLSPKTMLELSKAVTACSDLIYLKLAHCDVEDEGIVNFAPMLKEHPHLRELVLSSNNIQLKGVKALCSVITNNPRLLCINLSMNPNIGYSSGKQLVEATQKNNTLLDLDIAFTKIEWELENSIANKVAENIKIFLDKIKNTNDLMSIESDKLPKLDNILQEKTIGGIHRITLSPLGFIMQSQQNVLKQKEACSNSAAVSRPFDISGPTLFKKGKNEFEEEKEPEEDKVKIISICKSLDPM